VAQGMQPLVSRAFGVQDTKTIKKLLKHAMCTMTMISGLIYAVLFVWAEPIVTVFNDEGNALLQSMAVDGMRLYFSAVWFIGFNVVMSMYFTAIENPVPAQMISVLRGIVLVIPIAFGMAYIWGITGVWLTMVVTEGLVCVMGIWWLKSSY
jgi:Na+-driven multidrug efflux pump